MGIISRIYQSIHESGAGLEIKNAANGVFITFDSDDCIDFILLTPNEARELAELILTTANEWEHENT